MTYAKRTKPEEIFINQIESFRLPAPQEQYRFHPTRRWRFDGAYPEIMVAYEIEGGVWVNGGHNRGSGFIRDAEKYNEAARLGWCLLRFPSVWITEDYIAVMYLKQVLQQKGMIDEGEYDGTEI